MGLHNIRKFGLKLSTVSFHISNMRALKKQSFSGDISTKVFFQTDMKKIILYMYQNPI